MKKLVLLGLFVAGLVACNNMNSTHEKKGPEDIGGKGDSNTVASYDPNRGEGKFTSVEVSATLDAAKAGSGEKVYSVKCSACHKLTGEKLVGPGWKGVTGRHTAAWIMNFATNPDEMINKDPKAQAMLEICLVRMPNQNLTGEDARNIYEFMRKNDGVK